jgi:hypothetical protein
MSEVTIEQINGKTKLTYKGRRYYGIKSIDTEGEKLFVTTANDQIFTFNWSQVTENFGTGNAEELADYYTAQNFFLVDKGLSPEDAQSLKDRVDFLENNYVKGLWFMVHNSPTDGATGSITPPENGSIIENGWGDENTAMAKEIVDGKPTNLDVQDNDTETPGTILSVTVDIDGNYIINGNCDPVLYPSIAIIFHYRVTFKNYNDAFDLKEITEIEKDKVKLFTSYNGASQNLGSTFIDMEMFANVDENEGAIKKLSDTEIQFMEKGKYLIFSKLNLGLSSILTLTQTESFLFINDTKIDKSQAHGFNINASGGGHTLPEMNGYRIEENDTLKVKARVTDGNTNVYSKANVCTVSIIKAGA